MVTCQERLALVSALQAATRRSVSRSPTQASPVAAGSVAKRPTENRAYNCTVEQMIGPAHHDTLRANYHCDHLHHRHFFPSGVGAVIICIIIPKTTPAIIPPTIPAPPFERISPSFDYYLSSSKSHWASEIFRKMFLPLKLKKPDAARRSRTLPTSDFPICRQGITMKPCDFINCGLL